MPIISVKTDLDRLLRDAQLDQRKQTQAAVRALNVAARGLRTDAGRELHKRYPKLSTRDIGALIDVRLASEQSMRALVVARGWPLSLRRFYAGKITKYGSGGVWVDVKGGKRFIQHAFVAKGRDFGGDSRSEVIFIRHKYRPHATLYASGLVALRTVNVPDAMNIYEVRAVLDELVHDRFDKELARQITVLTASRRTSSIWQL